MSESRFVSTTKSILKGFVTITTKALPTVIVSGVGIMSHHSIQEAREISDLTLKETIKTDFSNMSSFVGLTTVSVQALDLLYFMSTSNAWKNMPNQQRCIIVMAAIVGTGLSTFAAFAVGEEKHTRASYTVAGAASLLFSTAKTIAERADAREVETLRTQYQLMQ